MTSLYSDEVIIINYKSKPILSINLHYIIKVRTIVESIWKGNEGRMSGNLRCVGYIRSMFSLGRSGSGEAKDFAGCMAGETFEVTAAMRKTIKYNK